MKNRLLKTCIILVTVFSLISSVCYASGMDFSFNLYAKTDDDNKWVYGYRFDWNINHLLNANEQNAKVGLTSKSSSAVGSLYFKVCKRDEVDATISGVATTSGVVASSTTTSLKLYYYTAYHLKTGRYDLYAWTKTKDCSVKGGWNP